MAIKMLARMCRSEGGGRERHFARGNCGSKAERKQVGMGADDEAWHGRRAPLLREREVRRFWRVQSAVRLSLFNTCEREQVDLLVTELEKKS